MSKGRDTGFRIDFIIKPIAFDEKEHIVRFEVVPDPRRYEWQQVEGKKRLYDKLDKLLFPEDVLERCMEAMKDKPLTFEKQEIDDAKSYVGSRRSRVENLLEGKADPPTFSDPSDEFLRSLNNGQHDFVILSLDLCGSTKLATTLSSTTYVRVIETALFEISAAAPLFHGHVLKYTGDGIIAYFPAPSFIRKNDLGLDAAMTMSRLIYEAINPALAARGWPILGARIGLDSGSADVVEIGSPSTKQQKDIIGRIVSLACKIQAVAPDGGIAMGATTYRHLYTSWRLGCEEYTPSKPWPYTTPDGDAYKLYVVTAGWQDYNPDTVRTER